MFTNKNIFDDENGESETLPPNQLDAAASHIDDRKTKMKDILAQQRALAQKKKEAKRAGVFGVKMTTDEAASGVGPPNIVKKQSSSIADNHTDDGKGRSSEGSSSMEAIEPIFDPTAPTELNALAPSALSLAPSDRDLRDPMAFLNSPPPEPVQCYIIRQRSGLRNRLYPKYELYLKNGDRFLLAAKKRTKNKSSNYLISTDTNDLNKASASFIGKLRSNFIGTEFTIYDNGAKPKEASPASSMMAPKSPRKELGCIFYQSNILGSRGPRKMSVLVPAEAMPDGNEIGFLETFKKGEHLLSSKMLCLENKPPKWSDQVGAYVLNFNGRVTMASVKNFQLIQTGMNAPSQSIATQDSVVIMQFGRVAKDNFTMDFRAPLTPLQAFAVALSSFDYKIACE